MKLLIPGILVQFLLVSQGCTSWVCSDDQIAQISSPDQKRIATVSTRDCGATTGYATQVAVRWQTSNPDPANIVFSVDGKREVQVIWLDDQTLSLNCFGCSDDQVFRRVTKLGRVTINFNGERMANEDE